MSESGEKRKLKRAKRRVMVRYGTRTTEKTAFTKNVSETGMFLQTNAVFKPGTTIQVQAEFPDQTFTMWARVVWAKKVPPQLAHILGSGMGICFIDPTSEWIEYYHRWARDSIRS
jgi:Tfp pilus assembly protein PilZ